MQNDVRLIDANAADVERICCYYGDNCRIEDVQEWLDDQPTIDAAPVVHAFWRHIGGDEWCCTDCALVISTEGSWEKPWQAFCPNCGAKMDGGAA